MNFFIRKAILVIHAFDYGIFPELLKAYLGQWDLCMVTSHNRRSLMKVSMRPQVIFSKFKPSLVYLKWIEHVVKIKSTRPATFFA